MPSALRFPDGSYSRHTDIRSILERFHASACVEIVGFSNLGKSELLRLLAQRDVWQRELGEAAREFLPVYIDCNRMVEVTDQGIYELILRCLRESDEELAANEELSEAYERLTMPTSEFQIPLSFNRGLTAAVQVSQRILVLLFDEFDEAFAHVDSRVFLNLRATKDRYNPKLLYATATNEGLDSIRPGEHCAEFCELFVASRWHLAPLTAGDVAHYVRDAGERIKLDMEQSDGEFLYLWTGGHPGLLKGATQLLLDALAAEGVDADHWQVQRRVAHRLRESSILARENQKIWQNFSEAERSALLAYFGNQTADPDVLSRLEEKHILIRVEGEQRAFSRLFALFVQGKQAPTAPAVTGLWVDVDSGEVLIDGKPAETLTKLEYQLMTLLFENADKIIDKYEIVTGVWGEGYINEVDDARIEKLISRLRQKVEPDPTSPRFITTVRGRGYRLLL
ncbi:MAG: winged helix-turn-helix transcriptional regulator [Caldilineaceae bacterium]|nr:winged helix-turn-helix transcriptional regulator [Caldilineaceae bacterium]